MFSKNQQRIRRAQRARAKIRQLGASRLCVLRSNKHITVQLIADCGSKTLASASTVEKSLLSQLKNGSNIEAAVLVGKTIAERASQLGIKVVAFDRSGYKFHGRVKALADAAREAGLEF